MTENTMRELACRLAEEVNGHGLSGACLGVELEDGTLFEVTVNVRAPHETKPVKATRGFSDGS